MPPFFCLIELGRKREVNIKMKKIIIFALVGVFSFLSCLVYAVEEKSAKTKEPSVSISSSKYSIDIKIKDIPTGLQTLFIPIKIDTMILDFDKVALESLAAQNILAVASTSKDKVGTGIGLLKLDESGLPQELDLKVYLKQVGTGQTDISLMKVADEDALPVRGAQIINDVKVLIGNNNEVEVTEKLEKDRKKLVLNQNKLIIEVQRPVQKEESIFIPILFDKSVVDLDETFGHAIVGPGITAKSFSSGTLHEGGAGLEIVLSDTADKDFTVDVDLIPKKSGKAKITTAFPQKGHTALITGPVVNINPTTINVASVVNPD